MFHNTQGTISEYAIHEHYFYRMTKRHYGDWTALRPDCHRMQITCMAYDVAEGSFLQARYLTKK
jgi:hypothetical protein